MPTTSRYPPSSRPSNFARDAVFAAFGPRRARALDEGAFVDRLPNQAPRLHAKFDTGGEAALDQLAKALRQFGGDTGLQP